MTMLKTTTKRKEKKRERTHGDLENERPQSVDVEDCLILGFTPTFAQHNR